MPYKLVKSDDDKILFFSIIIAGVFFFYLMPALDKQSEKEDFIEEFQNINSISTEFLSDLEYGNSELDSKPLEFINGAEVDFSTNLEIDKNLVHRLDCRHECCNFPGNLSSPEYLKGKNGIRSINNFGRIYTCSKGCVCFNEKSKSKITTNSKNNSCKVNIDFRNNLPHTSFK